MCFDLNKKLVRPTKIVKNNALIAINKTLNCKKGNLKFYKYPRGMKTNGWIISDSTLFWSTNEPK